MESANGFEMQNNSTYLIAYEWVHYRRVSTEKEWELEITTMPFLRRILRDESLHIMVEIETVDNSFSDFATKENMHWDFIFGRIDILIFLEGAMRKKIFAVIAALTPIVIIIVV